MADFDLEPGETETLRHAPGWADAVVVAVILLVEFAILAAASREFEAEPMRFSQGTLAGIIVAALFVGAALQFAVLAMPPLLTVTDRRIVLRRRLGWDEPDMLRLEDITEVRREGWRLVIADGGVTLSVFCPPTFAPRMRRAIAGARTLPSAGPPRNAR